MRSSDSYEHFTINKRVISSIYVVVFSLICFVCSTRSVVGTVAFYSHLARWICLAFLREEEQTLCQIRS